MRDALRVVKPVGWVVLALGVVSAIAAALTHWRELAVVAAACGLLVLVALPFLAGRTRVRVQVMLEPERVSAGESASASVEVTNVAGGRLLPTTLDLPVGRTTHRYGVPSLGPGERFEEAFTLRTDRRGVIPVGPALTRRGDPLSLCSRDVSWTGVTEVFVRPVMAPLESLGAGLLRDLEGVSTDAISHSDLAFHALREYVPGDDLRHVHWKSSAKAMAASGDTQLLVRQYLDTRRSHATIVVEDLAEAWPGSDEAEHDAGRDSSRDIGRDADRGRGAAYELALSVAGSLARRAGLDDFEVSFACGEHAATGADANRTLDAICRCEPTAAAGRAKGTGLTGRAVRAGRAGKAGRAGGLGLVEAARRSAVMAPDTSLLFLIGSALTAYEGLQRAAAAYPPEVRAIAIQIDPTEKSRMVEVAGMPVLRVAALEDLAGLLRWSLR